MDHEKRRHTLPISGIKEYYCRSFSVISIIRNIVNKINKRIGEIVVEGTNFKLEGE